jgi:DNA-binding transcriptional MerR regulator
MKIGKAARRAGVSVDTLRFYERRGILPSPTRRASGYRIYPDAVVERVRLVKYMQALGMHLDEIREALNMLDAGSATCKNQRPRFEAVIERIDRDLRELRATRTRIVQLLRRCESGKCSFQWTAR